MVGLGGDKDDRGGRNGIGGYGEVVGGTGAMYGGLRKVWGWREGDEVAATANDFLGGPSIVFLLTGGSATLCASKDLRVNFGFF